MYPSYGSHRYAQKTGTPEVISPHGMLDSWALKSSHAKKALALKLFEYKHLASAKCIHALCDSERQAIRDLNLRNPICVIPNGVITPTIESPETHDKNILLFLGRIHPKKGLQPLIQAIELVASHARNNNWALWIAGWDQGGHQAELEKRTIRSGIADIVEFIGPKFDADKRRVYAAASAFVLPSFSEGLPMTVLEAWAHGLPTLITRHCNLVGAYAAGAAIEISTEPRDIASVLIRLFGMSHAELGAIGANAKQLAQQQYDWESIAGQFLTTYAWLLGDSERPTYVDIA